MLPELCGLQHPSYLWQSERLDCVSRHLASKRYDATGPIPYLICHELVRWSFPDQAEHVCGLINQAGGRLLGLELELAEEVAEGPYLMVRVDGAGGWWE